MGSGKMELTQADDVASSLVDDLSPAFRRLIVAGSIRRRKPVVGDIEMVGIVDDMSLLVDLLSTRGVVIKPGVPDVIPWTVKPGAKYVRVRLREEINLDLFLATPDNWGGLLLMRTGSGVGPSGNAFDSFTVGMFARWKKVSAGGRMVGAIPTRTDGTQVMLPEEDDFFRLLGMRHVPPEERRSRSVIKEYLASPT
jgi:DNA polymerase/3'-5' exonuclease PolX